MLDWLANHGEAFIAKNTAIGKSLQRAKALKKSHEHFENVAQVGEDLSEMARIHKTFVTDFKLV